MVWLYKFGYLSILTMYTTRKAQKRTETGNAISPGDTV